MTAIPAFTPHRYRSACGGLELFARIYPGEGETLLLMHGLTRNSADFEPLVPHLAGRYRLIVPDQRGRGLSEWDGDPANYRPDIYCADMVELLDGLGIERAGLIGTSMGGLMAMGMHAMQPARVSAIVLNDVGPALEPEGLARIQSYVGPGAAFASWRQAAERCAAINASAFPGFTLSDWLAFAHRTCQQEADGTVRFAYDPVISESMKGDQPSTVPVDLWPLWDALSAVPLLVLRGALSDLLSAATVARMAQRHAGPFQTVEVPDRGHAPLLDEPAVLAALLPFLAAHVG